MATLLNYTGKSFTELNPRNGLTPTISSQRMTSCALPKAEPVGDALQLTALQPTDYDDDDDDDDDETKRLNNG